MTKFTSSQLRTLRNASEGVQRVTDQIRELVFEVAYAIVECSPKTEHYITVAGENFAIRKIYFAGQGRNYSWELIDKENTIFSDKWKYEERILGSFELSDTGSLIDPEYFYEPTLEKLRFFAENLGSILQTIISEWIKQEQETTDLLKTLKENLKQFVS